MNSVRNFISIFILLLNAHITSGQVHTNLEIVDKLIISSIDDITTNLISSDKNLNFRYNAPSDYETLKYQVINNLKSRGFNLAIDLNSNVKTGLEFSVTSLSTAYPESYRDGIFGKYNVKRDVDLQGSFLITESGIVKVSQSFEKTFSDTIGYDDLDFVEGNLPFTKGSRPSEPFFNSLLEPVIAIGATAVTIILFFTVRSK